MGGRRSIRSGSPTRCVILRRAIRFVLIAIGLFVVAAVGFGITLWTWGAAPSDFPQAANALAESRIDDERGGGRIFRHVGLRDARLGAIGFTISLPDPAPRRRLPVVFVLGALGTGRHSVGLIRRPGANAIVGYDWPEVPAKPGPGHLLSLRNEALSIPGQMSVISHWVLAQHWADAHRVTLAGFSLGAIAAPAVEHVMLARGVDVRWTVLADGGAPISAVVAGDRQIRPRWLRWVAAFVAELFLHPLDPVVHLSQLRGHFLLISSADDPTISARASERLAQLAPTPKRVIRMPGGHVGTVGAKVSLLDAAVDATRRWLIAEGAIDAGPRRSPR